MCAILGCCLLVDFLPERSIYWSQVWLCFCPSPPLCQSRFALHTQVLLCWGCKCLLRFVLLLDCFLYHYVVSFFFSYYSLGLNIYFIVYKYCYPSLFYFHLHEIYFSTPLLLVSVYLLIQDGSLGSCIYMSLVFLSIQLPYVFWLGHLSHLHLRWWMIDIYVVPFHC